jgi:hypothetical protein
MSAYGTKKRGGDQAVQLTFPLNYQQFARVGSYYPVDDGQGIDLLVGSDFQSNYHEQKRLDANKSVMDGLQARASANRKLLTGHANYHLPRAVLGQRKFANPSFGGVGDYSSARRDQSAYDAPYQTIESSGGIMTGSGQMVGGVVKTREGFAYYEERRRDRIDQLDRLNALAQGFAVPAGQSVQPYSEQMMGPQDKVNFFIYLSALNDAMVEGVISNFTFENFKEMLSMLFKFAPIATEEEFEEMLKGTDNVLEAIRGALEVGRFDEGENQYLLTLTYYVEQMREYIVQMVGGQYLQPRERKTLSRSLITSLGFTKLAKHRTPEGVNRDLGRSETTRGTAWRESADNHDDGYDDDDDDDDDGRFDRPAETREDQEADGMPRAPFAGEGGDPNRERFGRRRNPRGGPDAPPAFFGDDAMEDAEPGVVAPLGLSGFDPNAQAPDLSGDPLTFRDAVDGAIQIVLNPLRETSQLPDGQDADADIIESNYPDTSVFANEVAKVLKERGFTEAQIAKGMEQVIGIPPNIFAEYIAEHTGPTGPAPASPARPSPALSQSLLAQAPVALPESPADSVAGEDPFARYDLPRTRAELRSKYNTIQKIAELGARLPPSLGGPYRPRATTKPKTAIDYLIRIFKQYVSPTF